MTPLERALWNRLQRRASTLSPELSSAILRAFRSIADQMTEVQMVRAIQLGGVDRLFQEVLTRAVLDVAYAPVRERLRSAVSQGVRYYARDLPSGGTINGTLTIGFDILNPRVIDAVRTLETKVITTLDTGVRETVQAHIENGLRDGVHPRTVARTLRSVIGLAPNQEQAVRNFELALRGQGRDPLDYKLRDKRFDKSVAKGPLTEAQIEKMVAAYRKRMIAFNAETNARTAALDAQKLAQRLSYEDAIAKGIIDRDKLWKRWSGVMDDRERPEHVALQGEETPFDSPYSNGEVTPGSSTFNCRCLSTFFVRTP